MRTLNLTKKNIRKFTPKNTLYISKKERGYSYFFLCKFIEFKRGIVTGEVLRCDGEFYNYKKGQIITARLTKCLLWGKVHGIYERCHWFEKDGVAR